MKCKTLLTLLPILGLILVLGILLIGLPTVVGAQESESQNSISTQIILDTTFTYQGPSNNKASSLR
ncbi:MAG: hypothetical protein PVF45_05775, partial [Anaerolineae bacterium]